MWEKQVVEVLDLLVTRIYPHMSMLLVTQNRYSVYTGPSRPIGRRREVSRTLASNFRKRFAPSKYAPLFREAHGQLAYFLADIDLVSTISCMLFELLRLLGNGPIQPHQTIPADLGKGEHG